MLNETNLGAMLEDVARQFAEHALDAVPNRKLTGADVLGDRQAHGEVGVRRRDEPPGEGGRDVADLITVVVRGGGQEAAAGPVRPAHGRR